ncbi:MAG: ATP-binding cassette domain-containing protein [Dehalococcoidia bacterium]|nr:MAG: ATP-binding cassette domain-containing protein [Dehalococcoidia bacterium]
MFKERDLHRYDEFLIQMRDITKAYKTEAGDFLALKDIKLSVGNGEFVGVIGKSGSGKSTLINMIAGIDRPTKGEIYIGGTPIHTFGEGQMAKWRGRNLGIVFQFFQLLPILTVIENVMLPMDFCNIYTPGQRRKMATQMLELVGVAEQANKMPSQLSGGEQQRVAIARALANDPPIILADEPTGNLDSKTADRIFNLFEALVAGGKTVLMVTHDRDLTKRVQRTVIISDGEIIEEYVGRIFPSLTQEQLIWVTSKMHPKKYPAGSVIIEKGTPADKFCLVTKGRADVVLKTPDDQEFTVARIGRGEYFGELELMGSGVSTATVRAAADHDVEVLCLNRENFKQLIAESEATKKEIERVAQRRLKERKDFTEES